MSITKNINEFKANLPESVKLVAVSKTKPNNEILEAYYTRHKIFGENRVQDLIKKHEELPKDIEWHFIGHLQTNKVKYIASFISVIHAVDGIKLLKKINNEAKKNNRVIDCLLQIHIAEESSKFGLTYEELKQIITTNNLNELKNIRIIGLMGMATYTNNSEQIKKEFDYLGQCFKELKNEYFIDNDYFREISMGMSDDYKLAIKSGSTMIRVGSSIFGKRNY
jgi:hypothetical protein